MSLSLSQTLAGMSEYCSPLLEGCQKNRQHWKRLAEECEKGLVNGLVWSKHQFGFQPTQISRVCPVQPGLTKFNEISMISKRKVAKIHFPTLSVIIKLCSPNELLRSGNTAALLNKAKSNASSQANRFTRTMLPCWVSVVRYCIMFPTFIILVWHLSMLTFAN